MPYVNAAPLVYGLPDQGVEVVTAVPSALPALLDAGEVQAILVSSVFALVNPDLSMVDGVGIASHRRVTSVKIFSRVPLHDIQTLALDASSMTSNRLALEILREHGSHPATLSLTPRLEAMLDQADACVLIGDIGMTAHMPGVREYDLGEEWRTLTGLPFLWAGWVGREIPDGLAAVLSQTTQVDDAVAVWSADNSGLPLEMVREYLFDVMAYRMTGPVKEGYREYARRIDAPYFPKFTGPGIQS